MHVHVFNWHDYAILYVVSHLVQQSLRGQQSGQPAVLLNIPKMEVQFRMNATLTDTISRLRCETEIQLMGSLSDTHVRPNC